MSHGHGRHGHAGAVVDVRRHGPHNNQGSTTTLISIVYETAPATFAGPIGGYTTLTQQAAQPAPTNTSPDLGVLPPVQQTRTPPAADTTDQTTTANGNATPTTMATLPSTVATTALTSAAVAGTLTASSPYGSASPVNPSPTSANAASGSGGMSGGAKAGLAIGIILLIGLIAGLAFFCLRKRRQSEQAAQGYGSEKPFGGHSEPVPPPPPPPISKEPLAAAANAPAPSKPPQLKIRPVTQFAPDFSPSSGTAFGAGAGAAAGAAAGGAVAASPASRNLTGNYPDNRLNTPSAHASPRAPNGQNPFNDPVNPFGNQAEAATPPMGTPNLSNGPAAPVSPSASIPPAAPVSGVVSSGTALEVAGAGAAMAGAGMVASVSTTSASSSERSEEDGPGHADTQGSSPPSSPDNADSYSMSSTSLATTAAAPSNVHRVQMDFEPSMDDELGLRAGQLVRMLHEYDDGWALCIRLDRSQQGVCPRTCLSARPVKPRVRPPPGAGPGPRGPPPPGRPMSPMGPPPGRPMSPAGGRMPMAYSAGGQPPRFYPPETRPLSPSGRAAAGLPPIATQPMPPAQFSSVPRSMSPGPYGHAGWQKPAMPVNSRARSNSAGGPVGAVAAPPRPIGGGGAQPKPSPLAEGGFTGPMPASSQSAMQIPRKPVTGA